MIKLDEAISETNKEITASLKNVDLDLSEMTGHLASAMGKGIRTVLLLNASMNEDGNIPDCAIKAAVAIELLHMATLVHDDVIDDSPLRRGIETVQHKFGKKKAVICGDYLLCMSLSALSSISLSHVESIRNSNTDSEAKARALRFSRALSHICLGEYNQYQNNGNIDLDMFTYLRIISGKTAALFYISAYLGASLGSESNKNISAIGRFGKYLGLIFQIIDDCKDYEFSEEEALKSVGNDIVEGVVTLPLIMALKKEPMLRNLAMDAIKTGTALPQLIDEVRRLGGSAEARTIAERYEHKAKMALKNISGVKAENLLRLLEKAVGASPAFYNFNNQAKL